MINGGYMPLSHSDGEEEALHASEPPTESLSTHQNGLRPVLSHADDPDKSTSPLSLQRKLCLSFSILMCFIYVIAFLAFMPCFDSSDLNLHFINKWSIYLNFENATSVLAPIAEKEPRLVIGLNGGDLVSVLGTSGNLLWDTPLYKTPRGINCGIFQSSKGSSCLVWGNQSLLALVNPMTGAVIWYLHSHNDAFEMLHYVDDIDPVAIPDADRDGVPDLIILLLPEDTSNTSYGFYLGLVSGSSGQLIGASPFGCPASNILPSFSLWEVNNQSSLAIHCGSQNASILWSLFMKDFISETTDSKPLTLKILYSFFHPLKNVSLLPSPSCHYLIVFSNRTSIFVLHGNKFMYRVFMDQGTIRASALGYYKNYIDVLALLYYFPNGTHLFLVNIQDGKFIKSIPMENAATFSTLPGDLNAILIKTAAQEKPEFDYAYKITYHLINNEIMREIASFTYQNVSSKVEDMSAQPKRAALVKFKECTHIFILSESFKLPLSLENYVICPRMRG